METEPTVFVVDDDAPIRAGLQFLLESVGLRVETFESAEAFLAGYDPARPGCLILDVRMHGMDGLTLQNRLAASRIEIPIIIVTGHGDVSIAVRAMKSGAIDCLEKPVDDRVLLERIRDALARDDHRRRQRATELETEQRLASLTPRERQVLDLVLAGKPNKQIAAHLDVTTKTVEAHRHKMMQKMGAANLTTLVRVMTELRENTREES
jgi:two-component system, LuxR family, response regulator FixJ